MDYKYTRHAREQMESRRVTEEEIVYVLQRFSLTYPAHDGGTSLIAYFEDGSHLKIWVVNRLPFNLGEYGRWIEVDEVTNVDLSSDGRVLGVEFLYFGNLTASRDSLNLKKPVLSPVVIDAVLEAQEILVKKLSSASL
jgi:uncharacterized protein YuzE